MRIIFWVFSFCLSYFNLCDRECIYYMEKYKVISTEEGKQLLNAYGLGKIDEVSMSEFNENWLRIFKLQPEKYLVLPNDYNLFPRGECNIAYIFYDRDYLQDCIEQETFPEECRDKRIFQKYQDYLVEINMKEDEVFEYFLNRHHINIKAGIKKKDVEKIYNILKPKPPFEFDKEFIYVAHAISLYIKNTVNANWILIKERGEYSKYYVPGLMDESGKVWMVFHDLERYKSSSRKGGDASFEVFNKIVIKQILGEINTETLIHRDISVKDPFIVLKE